MNGQIRDGLTRMVAAAVAAVIGLVLRASGSSDGLTSPGEGLAQSVGGLLLLFALILFIWGGINVMKGLQQTPPERPESGSPDASD